MAKFKSILYIFACMPFSSAVYPNEFRKLQNDIGISARFCKLDELLVDADDWKLRAADFVARGFTPVRIFIDNKSDRTVLMSEHSTKFVTNIDVLTSQLKCHEIGRPLGLITGLYGIGAIAAAVLIHLVNKYPARGVAALRAHPDLAVAWFACAVASVCWTLGILYSPFYWYRLRESNRRLADILKKALRRESLIIPPRYNAEKIVFIYSSPGWSLVKIGFLLKLFDQADENFIEEFYIDLDKRK